MKTKTFKIGEYAIGGIIQVKVENSRIGIKCIDWDTKKTISHYVFMSNEPTGIIQAENHLEDLTSHYYADKILTWIKKNI